MKSVLDSIGNTPLVNLDEYVGCRCYAKMEYLNPSGSIKDRIAFKMLDDAIINKKLKPGMQIVEATSGNTGIALSMVASILHYPITIVMPENMSIERQKIMKAYGANVILTKQEQNVEGAVKKAKEIAQSNDFYMPNQFENKSNVLAQQQTAYEAINQIEEKIDIFVTGIGSGGTIQGFKNILSQKNPDCKIIAVEPKGASILNNQPPKIHQIQGIGDGFIPPILDSHIIDDIIEVSDLDAINTTKALTKKFGLFCGISSGANIYACQEVVKKYGKEKTILTILPDRGDRYLSENVF